MSERYRAESVMMVIGVTLLEHTNQDLADGMTLGGAYTEIFTNFGCDPVVVKSIANEIRRWVEVAWLDISDGKFYFTLSKN